MLGLAVVYSRYQDSRLVQAVFYGIAPAVMAVIAIAAYKLARLTNRGDRRLWTISVVLAAETALTGAEIAGAVVVLSRQTITDWVTAGVVIATFAVLLK